MPICSAFACLIVIVLGASLRYRVSFGNTSLFAKTGQLRLDRAHPQVEGECLSTDKVGWLMPRPQITKAHPYTPKSGQFAGRTFETERSYRNALAQAKGFASWHEEQRAAKKVTPKSFGELRPVAETGPRPCPGRPLEGAPRGDLDTCRQGSRNDAEHGRPVRGRTAPPRARAHGRQHVRPPLSRDERRHDRRREGGATCAARGRRRWSASTPTRSRSSC